MFSRLLAIRDVIFSSFEWFTSFFHVHWREVLYVVYLVHSFSTSEWEACEREWTPERILQELWTTMNYELRCRMTNVYSNITYMGPVASLIPTIEQRTFLFVFYFYGFSNLKFKNGIKKKLHLDVLRTDEEMK